MSAIIEDSVSPVGASTGDASRPDTAADDYPQPKQAWYVVGVLLLCYIFSFVDRQIIGYLVEPIERDFGMSDSQVGLLSGLAFAFLYTVLGIPIARLADKMNRRNIIALGVFLWSLAATSCGLAKSGVQLFLGRIGVGIGEATLSPSAYSMMVDMFPREKQASAFSIYNMGITVGSALAALLGGVVVFVFAKSDSTYALPILGTIPGWQMAFIVTGVPGMLLPLLLLTIRDPKRRGLIKTKDASGRAVTAQLSMWEVFKYTWKSKAFYSKIFFAWGFMSVMGYGVGAWLPASINRLYGMDTGTIGILQGICILAINTPAVFFFGKISDRLTKKGVQDAPVIMCLVSAVAVAITAGLPYMMPNLVMAWVMIAISSICFHGYVALSPMIVSQVTPNQMRAQVSSMCLFVVNMLGLGVGPSLPPLFTKLFFHNDKTMIHWGLIIAVLFSSLIAAWLYASGRKDYKQKLAETAALH
jgi:MFS family permease